MLQLADKKKYRALDLYRRGLLLYPPVASIP